MSVISFVSELADKFAPLRAAFVDHLDDNFGEVLPHVLMADYCRIVVSARLSDPWVRKFLSELEDNFSDTEDDAVSNVIAVSFIEHLPPPSDVRSITDLLGEKLKRQYGIVFGQFNPANRPFSK